MLKNLFPFERNGDMITKAHLECFWGKMIVHSMVLRVAKDSIWSNIQIIDIQPKDVLISNDVSFPISGRFLTDHQIV